MSDNLNDGNTHCAQTRQCTTDVVDHRTLIFDKPDSNPTRSFLNAKQFPGAKKYKDQR